MPSGDQRGSLSSAWEAVSRRSPLPSVRTSQRLVLPLFASMSVVRTTKTTRVPSGDTRGSEIRCMASMSWTVKACDAASAAGLAHRAMARLTGKELFMIGSRESGEDTRKRDTT